METRDRALDGSESTILVRPYDSFASVDKQWLLDRLQLDPSSSPVDLEDGVPIFLDGEDIFLFDEDFINGLPQFLGRGSTDGYLIGADDGGLVGAYVEVIGEWLRHGEPEGRHFLIWVGALPDLRAQALHWLSAQVGYWIDGGFMEFSIDSPYLEADSPRDVASILDRVWPDIPVTLNGEVIRESAPSGLA